MIYMPKIGRGIFGWYRFCHVCQHVRALVRKAFVAKSSLFYSTTAIRGFPFVVPSCNSVLNYLVARRSGLLFQCSVSTVMPPQEARSESLPCLVDRSYHGFCPELYHGVTLFQIYIGEPTGVRENSFSFLLPQLRGLLDLYLACNTS